MALQRDNHYVPCLYLKRFAASNGRVAAYRILVADRRVPEWKWCSIKGVAYHTHLYTRMASGLETDEVEKWLKREFEDPAEEAIGKATSDLRLTPTDWKNLVRFLAAQDVRTPARLLEVLHRARRDMPLMLQQTLEDSVRKIEIAKQNGEPVASPNQSNSEYIPFRVIPEIDEGRNLGRIRAEVVVGRGLWLFTMRHLLCRLDVLLSQAWSILTPPDNLSWFTSDDPVVKLNYYGPEKYDFDGGWGKIGTEIYLPLGPRHLLYATIGKKPLPRGSVVPPAQAQLIRRFIAEHGHRFIFADAIQSDIPKFRPRIVNPGLLRQENEQWKKWHEEQMTAERELTDSKDS